jgi:hypothetical protein
MSDGTPYPTVAQFQGGWQVDLWLLTVVWQSICLLRSTVRFNSSGNDRIHDQHRLAVSQQISSAASRWRKYYFNGSSKPLPFGRLAAADPKASSEMSLPTQHQQSQNSSALSEQPRHSHHAITSNGISPGNVSRSKTWVIGKNPSPLIEHAIGYPPCNQTLCRLLGDIDIGALFVVPTIN